MKILYAIQGTGNGHISRARDIVPVLMKNHEVDLLISGTQADVELPYPVKYRFKGLSFVFGKNGGINLPETYRKNYIKSLLSEINSLPVENYELVINDFEPVSAWACQIRNIRCIAVSHQAAVASKKSPQPSQPDIIGRAIIKNYAPADAAYGFHFKPYTSRTFTPVIRAQVRKIRPGNLGHYTVYLPAYEDKKIINVLKQCAPVQWQIFSKHNKAAYSDDNIKVYPINNEAFIESMASAEGVLCGAGFETPAEALYLGKKLMVIPMKGQYEQLCNAAALKEMGVPVIKSLKSNKVEKINNWIINDKTIEVNYPDFTEMIFNQIIEEQSQLPIPERNSKNPDYSTRKLRNLILTGLISQF